jgi:pSer/pThr/pTyr-binding forkhead associated (FHA) protein
MTGNKTGDSIAEGLVSGTIPRLEATGGPLTGQTFYLDKPVLSIGRLASNDIWLEDPFVSRRHCLIRNKDGQYEIEDLNSANGTYVDGDRIHSRLLEDGSLIQIWSSQFVVRLQNPEESIVVSQDLISSGGEHSQSSRSVSN